MDDIGDRLRSHDQAFSGLLSLIPAKYYYGEEGNDDQWQRKKQTKEQAREAKRAKLDPDSAKTAKDVMDENARKRKREEGQADAGSSDDDGSELGSELPKEGLNRGNNAKPKKQKPEPNSKAAEDAEARKKLKEEKNQKKKEAQKEKKKAKEAAKKEKQNVSQPKEQKTPAEKTPESSKPSQKSNEKKKPSKADDHDDDDGSDDLDGEDGTAEGFSLDFNTEPEQTASSTNSPDLDTSNPQSGSSSISSIVPPTDPNASSSDPKPLKTTPEELKNRLQKRLDELRAARHADGLNGKPARNRQELIEARRQKAEQRKAHKKELRQKAREEEQREKDDAMARRFSPGGSGSLLASPRSPADSISSSNNFSFGRVVFADGQISDPSLSQLREGPKRHGHSNNDAAAALKAAEAKKARMAGLDEEKRADIEQKDMWLNAKKRAHGERVRDDTSLLKKALKRKETAKKKSEREWKDRLDAVKRGKEHKQTKREENLRKRRDEKGGSKGKKPSGGGNGGKKKSRPGFEGSFKAKSGGKK